MNINNLSTFTKVASEKSAFYSVHHFVPSEGYFAGVHGRSITLDKVTEEAVKSFYMGNSMLVNNDHRIYIVAVKQGETTKLFCAIHLEDKRASLEFGIYHLQSEVYPVGFFSNGEQPISIPMGQASGTAYQQASYAKMKAQEVLA